MSVIPEGAGPGTRVLAGSPALARVDRLCEELERLGALGDTVEAVHRLRAGLADPLRLAVVGRVKAGKSTLVNSLIGRYVAPTAAGECTRVVTWYCYGSPDRAEIHLRTGGTRRIPFVDGLPDDLGVPVVDVSHIVVHLQSGALRDLTLIDTPGLATLNVPHAEATQDAVLGLAGERSFRAAGQADAVLFAFRESERADEMDFLREFRASSGELGASAVNAVGVLTQADLFGSGAFGGDDPFALARSRAARIAEQRAAELSAVVPVSGLMAQTSRTGRLRENDVRELAALDDLDPVELQLLQMSPPEGDQGAAVTRLFERLGPYGVRAGRRHARQGLGGLATWLDRASGVAELEDLIRRRLLQRAAALRASHALGLLTRVADIAADPVRIRGAVEATRLDPDLQPLAELRALQLVLRDCPDSPVRDDLERLTGGSDDAIRCGLAPGTPPLGIATAARRLAGQAQALTVTAWSPAEADAARVASRSYQIVARRAEGAVR